MDIFKMANQIAKNMSLDEKSDLDNMDMQEMISHVTKNVLGMMNNTEGGNPFAAFTQGFQTPVQPIETIVEPYIDKKIVSFEESEDDESNCIYTKTRDICFDLNVDLEDFYTGKRKKLNVKRRRMIEIDGKQTVIEEKKKLIIPIEKGMKDEQQICFKGEADQIPGYKPGDIIITLIENEHPFFQRDSDNLIIIKNINLYQSYNFMFDIKHLDNTIYRVNNNSDEGLHINDSIRKISGLGMPSYKSQNAYGDLFVRFNLVIPKTLNPVNLELLKEIFKDDPLFIENKLNNSFDKKIFLENVSDADLEDLYSDSDSEDDTDDTDDSEDSEEESEEESGDESEDKVVLISESESEGVSEGVSEESEEPEFVPLKKKKSLKNK